MLDAFSYQIYASIIGWFLCVMSTCVCVAALKVGQMTWTMRFTCNLDHFLSLTSGSHPQTKLYGIWM